MSNVVVVDGQEPRSLTPLLEFMRQVSFIAAAVLLYFGVRGMTQGNAEVAIENGLDVLEFERRIGLDLEAWAQGLIIDSQLLVDIFNWIYIWGHWPVIAITLIWLHRYHRMDFLLLRNAMFISGAIGLVIFASYAVAPPRLLNLGLDDTVTQHSNAYRILQPPALVNKYAAVPSLHVGWNLLVGISLFASQLRLVRVFAIAGPTVMAIAVIVTANHYVIDGFLGSGLALFGLAISYIITPRIVEADWRFRQRLHDQGVIDDQAVEPPACELSSNGHVLDGPGEHLSMSTAQIGHQPRAQ
ncbi:MAG: phosphatase PAP2 family protein [Actinomycetia bacterium]|nr:phosphatase PAP2 family protein [Actinomycetes bacterium]MCP5031411.1 phosphatase PAP2 family protein [Actinomycetes bacterium]